MAKGGVAHCLGVACTCSVVVCAHFLFLRNKHSERQSGKREREEKREFILSPALSIMAASSFMKIVFVCVQIFVIVRVHLSIIKQTFSRSYSD